MNIKILNFNCFWWAGLRCGGWHGQSVRPVQTPQPAAHGPQPGLPAAGPGPLGQRNHRLHHGGQLLHGRRGGLPAVSSVHFFTHFFHSLPGLWQTLFFCVFEGIDLFIFFFVLFFVIYFCDLFFLCYFFVINAYFVFEGIYLFFLCYFLWFCAFFCVIFCDFVLFFVLLFVIYFFDFVIFCVIFLW